MLPFHLCENLQLCSKRSTIFKIFMLKKISVNQARVGMFIHEMSGSWIDNPFWSPSFFLRDAADLMKLQSSNIADLWIDTSKGVDIEHASAEAAQPICTPDNLKKFEQADIKQAFSFERQRPAAMDEEIVRAAKIIEKSRKAIASIFDDARMGRMSDTQPAISLVEDIASSVLRNSGALVSLMRLKDADDYTYMHSLAVCAMMIVLAKQLQLPDAQIRDHGLAGLFHDIGKMAIPAAILNKPGPLTDDEFITIQQHPGAGYAMLKNVVGMPTTVLDVCLHHHERMDGKGYPDKLAPNKLCVAVRMGAICDVYDAITSNRPYKKGWSPTESLRKMAVWAKEGHFDEVLFAAFVKCIGIYPIGSLVRLKSNRLAVVVDVSRSLLRPIVRVFFSITSMAYLLPTTLDLNLPGVSDVIATAEQAEKWGIQNLDRYWTSV